jgi:hypothetical protein
MDIVERFAEGDASRLPVLAAELVSLKFPTGLADLQRDETVE